MSNDAEWDAFLADADKDTRIGKQQFQVTSVMHDTWSDGRPRHKVKGILTTAGNAKCDMTMNAAPTLEEAKAAKAAGDMRVVKGIAFSKRNHDTLAQYDGATIETLGEGLILDVEVDKDKEGFVRVKRILSPGEASGAGASKASGSVPF